MQVVVIVGGDAHAAAQVQAALAAAGAQSLPVITEQELAAHEAAGTLETVVGTAEDELHQRLFDRNDMEDMRRRMEYRAPVRICAEPEAVQCERLYDTMRRDHPHTLRDLRRQERGRRGRR